MFGMAGLPRRRPDQAFRPPASPMPPGSRTPILARLIRIFGSSNNGSTGILVYTGLPATGNLIASVEAVAGIDPENNSYRAGIASYPPGSIKSARLVNGQLLFDGAAASLLNAPGGVFMSADAVASSSQPSITAAAPQTSAINNAALILFGESQDTTKPAQAVIGLSGAAPTTSAFCEVQGSLETSGLNNIIAGGDVQAAVGNLRTETAGSGVTIKEGSNAKQGTLTLNGTTAVVVNNSSITASSRIFLTIQAPAGAGPGAPFVAARAAGTSFSVKSTVAGDTSTCAYFITEPS